MPVRQLKESSEQHIVIKTNLQNPKNTPKASSQNGKAPPPTSLQNNNQTSPPQPRNKGRRRGSGGRKYDQGEILMRPSSRLCTAITSAINGNVENGYNSGDIDVCFPTSSKSMNFARRPGFGQVGTKCIVKANHFFAELPDKDLNQYDVRPFPLYLSQNWKKQLNGI